MNMKKIISVLLMISIFQITASAAEGGLFNKNFNLDSERFDVVNNTEGEEDNLSVNSNESDRFIVKFRDVPEITNEGIKTRGRNRKVNINKVSDISIKNSDKKQHKDLKVIQLDEAMKNEEFESKMLSDTEFDVEYVQPDYRLNISSTNDEQKNVLETINVEEYNNSEEVNEVNVEQIANKSETDSEVIVAIIDTGIDITHKNLVNNLWNNTSEQSNTIDEDSNGYIDDTIGWDFINDCPLKYDESQSVDYTHGTHVAGIISDYANELNNVDIKILPLRVFTEGNAYTSDIIEAIQYAETMGAKVVNCSFGGKEDNPALKEAIENSNMLFSCAAGNSRIDTEEIPIYPACYEFDNIISVAATNDRDYISYFSNYGNNIDISADGCSIESTVPNDKYGFSSGTSMSAAYISKALATIMVTHNTSVEETKQILLESADHISSLEGYISDLRKVNIDNIINNIYSDDIILNDQEDYSIDTVIDEHNDDSISLYGLESDTIDSISAGGYHSTVLIDGWVYSFGSDEYSQVSGFVYAGNDENIPAPGFCDIYSVKKISTRGDHTLVLMQDGTVRAWGRNNYGQLGNGTIGGEGVTDGYSIAEQVYGLSNIVDISAGHDFSLALDSEGTVYAWGNNKGGKLGIGSAYVAYTTPVVVSTINNIEQISAGHYHALAKSNSGIVYGWGDNTNGAIGDEEQSIYYSPKEINVSSVEKVVAGFDNSFFIKTDGSVYGCGSNANGQLGDGTMTVRTTPIEIPIDDVCDVSSNGTTIFLKENGEAYGCGLNIYGQLGQGNTSFRYTSLVKINGSYTQISAGGSHVMLLSQNGKLFAMGRNHKLQCGYGEEYETIITPTIVEAFNDNALTIDNVDVNYETNRVILSGEYNIPYISSNWRVGCTNKIGYSESVGVTMAINNGRYTAEFTPHLLNDGINTAMLYCNDDSALVYYEFGFEFTYDSSNVINTAEITYSPIEDTYIYQHGEDNNANFNDSQMLSINYTESEAGVDQWGSHALLKFNVNDIDKTNLLSAKLRVYVDGDSDKSNSTRTISFYDINNEWDSTQITWANSEIQTDSSSIAQFDVTGNGWKIENPGWHEIDITKYIYDNTDNIVSLMAKMTSKNADSVNVHSSEHQDIETRPELIIEYAITSDSDVKEIQISGQTDSQKDLIVRVFKPDNSIETIDQIRSDIYGCYYYNHRLNGSAVEGTYQTIVSTEDQTGVQYFETNYKTASNVNKIIVNEPEELGIPQAQLQAILQETTDDLSYLQVTGTITNSSEVDEQDNMIFTGIYDKNQKLYDYSTISTSTIGNESIVLNNQLAIPDSLTNYTVKMFVCEGKDLYSGSMSPISEIYTISSEEIITVASEVDSTMSSNDIELTSVPTYTDDLEIDISILNNGTNTEKILKENNNFSVLYTITNVSDENKEVTPILAFYGEEGMTTLNTGHSEMILKPNATITYSSEYTLATTDLTTDSAKIMVWNKYGGLMSYISTLTLTNVNADYYGDTFDTAGLVSLNCGFEGVIDTETDVDIVKFVPHVTALYTFNGSCDNTVHVSIYNKQNEEIISRDIVNGDLFSINLSAETEYYMKVNFDNNQTGQYSFSSPSILVPDYKSFTVSEWGVYTIQVPAGYLSLYDSNYRLLYEGNTQSGITGIELNKGIYYLYVNEANDYSMEITKYEIPQLELGKGIYGELTINDTYGDYYCFTPTESGTYIFSSTGSCSLKGILYSSTHTQIASADNDNYNDNFAIKRYLNAGDTYYIKVQSKKSLTGDYTVYVEEPLTVISID